MNTPADKTQENKSQSLANETLQKQSGHTSNFQLVDKRSETVAQRKLQEMANNSPQAMQFKTFQHITNNSPKASQTAQLQTMAYSQSSQQQPIQKKENNTGLPDDLKSGIENLSGYAMDDVKVHRNSDKPAQLNAHAYAQGTDIHLGPGQEKHLAHEAWHVVQQKQGRVKPTTQMKGKINVNDNAGLEKEADIMGVKAVAYGKENSSIQKRKSEKTGGNTIQRARKNKAELLALTVSEFDNHRKAEQMDWANEPDFTKKERTALWEVIDLGTGALAAITLQAILDEVNANKKSLGYIIEYCHGVNGDNSIQLNIAPSLNEAIKQGKWLSILNKTISPDHVKATIPIDKFDLLIATETTAEAFITYYKKQKPILQTPDGREIWAFNEFINEGGNIFDYTKTLPDIRNYHKFKKAALDKLVTDKGKEKTTPLLLMLYSIFDHNGAFHRHEGMHKVITDTHSRVLVLENLNIKKIEALAKKGMNSIAVKYGMEGKITQVVLAGHGSAQSVELASSPSILDGSDLTIDSNSVHPKYGGYDADLGSGDADSRKWEAFFSALFDNMAKKGGFEPKLLLRACATNSNDIPDNDLKRFMKEQEIIDLDTVVDPEKSTEENQRKTSVEEAQGKIKEGITRYIAAHSNIATRLRTIAGERATVLGTNASITADSVGSIKDTGELSIETLTDPAIAQSKLDYVEHGIQPKGAIQAVVESWAIDQIACLGRINLRLGQPVNNHDDLIIHMLYETIKNSYTNDILKINALADSAHVLSGVLRGFNYCRVRPLLNDPMIRENAAGLYTSLVNSVIPIHLQPLLVIYEAWLTIDDSKSLYFAACLANAHFNKNNVRDYIDIHAISAKINVVLNDATAPERGKDLLALIGFIDHGNADCATYLVASAVGAGNPLPDRIKNELQGYDETRLRQNLGLPVVIAPAAATAPNQNNVKTGDADNDYFVEPMASSIKNMSKATKKDRANIRVAPDPAAKKIASRYGNKDYTILGEVKNTTSGDTSGWYMIKLDNQKVGYIETKYF